MRANPLPGRDADGRPKSAGDGHHDHANSTGASYVDCVLFGRRTHPDAGAHETSPSLTHATKQPGAHGDIDAPSLVAPAAGASEPERT
jgi:hypothetical protein